MKLITVSILTVVLLNFLGCGNPDSSSQSAEQQVTVSAPIVDLHTAVYMMDYEAIRQHIKAGSNLNVKEPSRKSTPLITAAAFGEPIAAKILIDGGAELNYKNSDGSTALITAAAFGKTEVAKLLINARADLNSQNKDGSTALITATFFCRVDIVKALLENGADKTVRNKKGKTAFERVVSPFEDVKEIYDDIADKLKSAGLKLNYDRIKKTRPIIAEMLK